MAEVWLWESGEYSDYTVHGVYDSAETAKLAVEYSLTGAERLRPPAWRQAGDIWTLGDDYGASSVRPWRVETKADLAPTCRMPLLTRVRGIAYGEQMTFAAADCKLPLGHDGPHDWEAREAEILAETGAAWRMPGPAKRISA